MAMTLENVDKKLRRPRPTGDSAFCIPAFGAFLVSIVLEAAVVSLAYYRSPTYWNERFETTVGHRDLYISIIWFLSCFGAAMAGIALVLPFRKRGAALLALACNGFAGENFGVHYYGCTYIFRDAQWMVIELAVAAFAIGMILWRLWIDWHVRRDTAQLQ